jgi:hypothetical protein
MSTTKFSEREHFQGTTASWVLAGLLTRKINFM